MEKLVQLIEQSISPDSIVERNVRLPILTSPTAGTAQCDIVICTGRPPRQTITIVEVQDRQKPVDMNEFRGWLLKLKDVGAQHLYCVSRKSFSKGIKEQATLHGNTVKLITLKQMDINQIPLDFFETTFIYSDVDVPSIRKLETVFPALQSAEKSGMLNKVLADLSALKTNDQKFSSDRKFLKALSTICIEHNTPAREANCQVKTLDLGNDDKQPLYFYSDLEFFQIRLKIEYTWYCKNIEVPISMLSYEQNNDGALAWVLESFLHSRQGPMWFKIPVARNGNAFSISGMFISIPENTEFSFNIDRKDQA